MKRVVCFGKTLGAKKSKRPSELDRLAACPITRPTQEWCFEVISHVSERTSCGGDGILSLIFCYRIKFPVADQATFR